MKEYPRWRRVLLAVWHHSLLASAGMVLVLALYVGIGRQLWPLVVHYQPELEQRLSAAAGVPVHIGRLHADWERFSPLLHADAVELRSPEPGQPPLLTIPRVEIEPALFRSLFAREPRLRVRVQGLRLNLEQYPGGWRVRELARLRESDPARLRQLVSLVFRQPGLAVRASGLVLHRPERRPVTLDLADVRLANDGDQHILAGAVSVAGASRLGLQAHLTLVGDPLDWPRTRAALWLQAEAANLRPLLADWLPASVRELHAGGQFWLDFHGLQLTRLQSRLELPRLVYADPQGPRLTLSAARARGRFERTAAGWQLAAEDLHGLVNGAALPSGPIRLRETRRPDGRWREAELAVVDIGLWRTLRPLLAVYAPAAVPQLAAMAPTGRLRAVRLALREQDWQSLRLSFNFDDLSLAATERLPGVQGLDGWLSAGRDQARLLLDTRDASLDLRQVYREPIRLDRAVGGLRLQRQGGVWHLASDRLVVMGPDGRGEASLQLWLPEADPGQGRLRLLAGLRAGRAASTWRYVPWTAASDDVLTWLQRAITAGEVRHGQFLYDGDLHGPDHRLQMRFLLKQATLAFHPDWPALTGLDGEVEIDGRRLSIRAPQARLLNSRLSDINAVIPDLGHDPRLGVQGRVQAVAGDFEALIRASALREPLASVADTVDLDGPVDAGLSLSIPLAGGDSTVDVAARLEGNRLRVPAAKLSVDDVRGWVQYHSDRGLTAPELSGRLFNRPVSARIQSDVKAGSLRAVRVLGEGEAQLGAVRDWLGLRLWPVQGEQVKYQATLDLPVAEAQPAQLSLRSDLAGVTLTLPAPLGKAEEPLPSRLNLQFGDREQRLQLALGRRLGASLVLPGGDRPVSGLIHLGDERVDGALPVAGLRLQGHLPRLDLDQWRAWWRRTATGAALPEATATVQEVQLEAGELILEGYRLAQVRARALRESGRWQVDLASERVSGSVMVPDADTLPIEARLSRLSWPLATVQGDGALTGLSRWPLVQFRVEDFRSGGWQGELAGAIEPVADGFRAHDLRFRGPALSADGQLVQEGGQTRLAARLGSPDIARTLAVLGLDGTLSSREAQGELDIVWPGTVADLHRSQVHGRVNLRLRKGNITTAGRGSGGASKVLALLDVSNIGRRLRLDFSDLVGRGLSYDELALNGTLDQGVLTVSQFSLAGSGLTLRGQGTANLSTGGLDQTVDVTVPVSRTLPIAAALVAGPLIGGAVLAAEAVFEKRLAKFTTVRYRLRGTLDEPEFQLQGRLRPGAAKPDTKP